jgi:phage baseplate assembly protein W
MPEAKDYLGRGWSFPPAFDRNSGGVQLVEAREDIEQSLDILLSTSLGERVMQPEYGCNLRDLQFEPINATLVGYLRDLVTNAILYYEARIKLLKVEVSDENAHEGHLVITVEYLIRGTNSRYNYVYDFYTKEGAI